MIDVRLTLETQDGALIYLTYQGRFLAEPDAMRRFGKGEQLAPHEYSLAMIAKFECGNERYAWLNNAVAVGTGEQTATGPRLMWLSSLRSNSMSASAYAAAADSDTGEFSPIWKP